MAGVLSEILKGRPSKYGKRKDGTLKGSGFFGEIPMTDGSGRVMTEQSIGVDFGEGEMEIPLLVPTLTQEEIGILASGGGPTREMVDRAVIHARERLGAGQNPFK
jgi:hypothetical protein